MTSSRYPPPVERMNARTSCVVAAIELVGGAARDDAPLVQHRQLVADVRARSECCA